MELLERITIDPKIMNGVPCIRNMIMPVATILSMLAEGFDEKHILEEFPDLELNDIKAALKFASETLRTKEYPLAV